MSSIRIGSLIREARLSANMSLGKTSRLAKISYAHLHKLESGELDESKTCKYVYQLSKVLDLPDEVLALLRLDTVGGRLLWLRWESGYRRKDLVEKTGLQPMAFSMMEKYGLLPTGWYAAKLEELYGVSMKQLMEECR